MGKNASRNSHCISSGKLIVASHISKAIGHFCSSAYRHDKNSSTNQTLATSKSKMISLTQSSARYADVTYCPNIWKTVTNPLMIVTLVSLVNQFLPLKKNDFIKYAQSWKLQFAQQQKDFNLMKTVKVDARCDVNEPECITSSGTKSISPYTFRLMIWTYPCSFDQLVSHCSLLPQQTWILPNMSDICKIRQKFQAFDSLANTSLEGQITGAIIL